MSGGDHATLIKLININFLTRVSINELLLMELNHYLFIEHLVVKYVCPAVVLISVQF